MVSVGVVDDKLNQGYDILSTVLLIINLATAFAMTFEDFYAKHHVLLHWTEAVTVAFFAFDYILRLYTSDRLYPHKSKQDAAISYIFSGYGIIDLLSFLPYFGQQGYETYFFEGPGQGEVLMRCHIRMTPEWEHCTSAVLDHFNLDNVTLIGISLGGYLKQ